MPTTVTSTISSSTSQDTRIQQPSSSFLAAPLSAVTTSAATATTAELTDTSDSAATLTASEPTPSSTEPPSDPDPTTEALGEAVSPPLAVPTNTFDPGSLPELPAPDPEAAGPDNGAPCPADPQYSDEEVTGLDPNTAAAYLAARRGAAAVGIVMCLNDGKRSTSQQQATYDDYVTRYGVAVANQYVLPPEKSAHVVGFAIDVQPAAAFNWLAQTAGSYGLCRMYDNEAWHFEFSRTYAPPAARPDFRPHRGKAGAMVLSDPRPSPASSPRV
ncbi:D-alanyl-D-alanine carboxypeptidase family protein [Nakamurella antarctica]|uniref:D-alanyl-D-alanine carboxypeptidase family protein n=1 Tax=Nakamurella antarctica TaxID=1902245 RepID=UPI0013DE3F07|nr:D-alanyl-D-alanine carboxypeptidase family protein [Nakamurella antarctica]